MNLKLCKKNNSTKQSNLETKKSDLEIGKLKDKNAFKSLCFSLFLVGFLIFVCYAQIDLNFFFIFINKVKV